jgi:uncharacterized membrane protein
VMEARSWFYKMVHIAVSLGLIMQWFPLVMPASGQSSPRQMSPVERETLFSEAMAAPTAVSPTNTAISVSRSQSSYTSGSGLVITYTVTNQLPPSLAPAVTAGMNLTDTLAAIDAFDSDADANTLRQVILTNEWTAVTYQSASRPAYEADGVHTFLLGDIPPLGSATVVVTLAGPDGVTDSTALDTGAAAWATVHGRAVQAATSPATLWPAAMGDWLGCTLDANCADPYLIDQAGQLGNDPAAIFAFVRGLGYESYQGSLRGGRGTLWSEGGNSMDQASLLIALLRASGVPARYRAGVLADPLAAELILAMFPTPLGVIGYIPADGDLPLADPLQNPALWAETRDHYWVEAYLPGSGWTDLDPSFVQAQIGDRFVDSPDPTPLAELPASLRHHVSLQIKAELYNVIGGLSSSYPLTYTFSSVELVGEPVTLGHLVHTQNQGGMVFANIIHTYTPYLVVGSREFLYEGDPFQELLTSFPLATTLITGEWLQIELHHPDGTSESHQRALYDMLGYDARLNGGTINFGDNGRGNEPFISELSLFTGLFAPSFIPSEVVDREYAVAATAVTEGQTAYDTINAIMEDGQVDGDESDDLIAAIQAISRLTRASQRALLMQHAAAADFGTQRLGDAFLVRAYYDTPRVHLMAWETNTATGQQTVNLDLRRNKVRALPYAGQSLRGWQAFNAAYGLAAMTLESDTLQRFSPDGPVKSVANILTAAQAQAIPLVIISPANLDDLNDLAISTEAKARITADLMLNPRHFVIVPAAAVTLGEAETVGWLRGDIISGELIDVSEDGLHMVAVEYSIMINFSLQEIGFAMAGFGQGFAGFTFVFLGEFLGGVPGDLKEIWNAALAAATQWAEDMAELLAEMGDHNWIEAFINGAGIHGGGTVETPIGEFSFGEFDWRVGGFNNGAAFAASVIGAADPPLPPALAARLPEHEMARPATGLVAATATSSGTAVNGSVMVDSLAATGNLSANWSQDTQAGLFFSSLSGSGDLFVDGVWVGSGPLTGQAQGQAATAETSATAVAYQASGQAGLSFYAPAVAGLGAGSNWRPTAVTLTPAASLELTLTDTAVSLNGESYSGALTLMTALPLTLAGVGPVVAPQFAAGASLTAVDADLALGAATGSLTVGGTAVPLTHGLALPNFNGAISVAEAGPGSDTVTLNGSAHYFYLTTSPATSVTTPGQPATFQANIQANFSDSYTVTVSAPGWPAAVAANGSVTITPTLNSPPGTYTVMVTAQSSLYPTAVAAVEQTVTVNAAQGVELTIQPDPIYTIPFGQPANANQNSNNGQAQIPNAAYTVQIVNGSSTAHTFDVAVTGLAANWLIFAGQEGQTTTQITLPAGATTWLGLYVRPGTGTLPAPGGSHPFTVTAVAQVAPTVNDSDSATFVMPSLPFQHLWLQPATLFVEGGTAADFSLHLQNVGNAAGSFDLAATLPAGWSLSPLSTPVALNAGQSQQQNLTLNVPVAPLGRVYPVTFASPVPGQVYTQWSTLNVRIVSANTAPIFEAAVGCLAGETALAAALHALALAMAALEESCDGGDCALSLRDRVVDAAANAANYGRLVSPLGQTHADLTAVAAVLAGQGSNAAILATLPDLTTAVTALEVELCAILAHRPTARLTPWMDAALPGQAVSYDLAITNRGTLTTTYAVTVMLPEGGPLTFEQTIAPGMTEITAVPASATDLGLYLIETEVRALDAPIDYLTAQAEARLNVVDRFIQVTAVQADPAFVETGVSSTTVQIEIANIAGIGLSALVETAVHSPDGIGQWNDTIPLNILGGAPRLYDLAEVDTSGWAAGVYTITANLLLNGEPTAGGEGYGYLSVGQAVIPSHAVYPELVAPGTVTVTTAITTEINQGAVLTGLPNLSGLSSRQHTIYDAPYWDVSKEEELSMVNGQSSIVNEAAVAPAAGSSALPPTNDDSPPVANWLPMNEEEISEPLTFTYTELSAEELPAVEEPAPMLQEADADDGLELTINNSQLTIDNSFVRLEENDPAVLYTGTWTNFSLGKASDGSYWRSATAGSTAEFSFEGDWLNVGFIGTHWGGYVDIAINGASQGAFDLYQREDNTPISFVFANLGAGLHTVTLTVAGSSNPFSLGTRVQLDYIDYWDGAALGHGLFEEDDERVLRSNGWTEVSNANASGGAFVRGNSVTAWFPFDGDSFTYHALAYNLGNKTRLYVDGQYLDTVDLFHPNSLGNAVTRSFSYEGFGPGPHLLQISSYRDQTLLDALETPGQPPFTDPQPAPDGINRYEEDHPAIRYNGVPFNQTAQNWARVNNITSNRASDGQYIYSSTAGDTISFDFEGSWIGVGFATDRFSGQAEIAIDGSVVAEVDVYTREDDTAGYYFNDLGAGPHTITITILSTRHPNATNNRVHLDYFDLWDGQPLAEGVFEETDERLFYSSGWGRTINAGASGGGYATSGASNSTAWFPFTGDSVTFATWTTNNLHSFELRIDGVSQGHFNSYSLAAGSRAFSFDGLGDGPHVLELRRYRGTLTLDAFITPSTGEHYELPAPSSIIRLEEDHPDLRYNGHPLPTMAQSWSTESTLNIASGGWNARTSTAGNTLSLDFDGSWVGVGFRSETWSGVVEIFIDDVSQGTFDTSGPAGAGNIKSVYINDLGEGSHTISVTAVSGTVMPDFIDIWDGQPVDEGWYNADLEAYNGRFHYSNKGWWSRAVNQYAYEGDYLAQSLPGANPNIWFTFVGSDLTVLGFNWNNAILDITIDGHHYGQFNMTAAYTNQPYALHFPDLGDGPHVAQIHTRSGGRIDAFEVNPVNFYSYMPEVKWHSPAPAEALGVPGFYDIGLMSTIAIGDLNGDGIVELVAPSTNGRMYVYRGDGQDAGDGSPILWTSDAVGVAAEPALADLTGDGAAEIVVCGFHGTFAFRYDGLQLWDNDAVKCFWQDSGPRYFGWGGPTIGNLDDDPEPEIVIAARADALYVLDHQGNTLDSDPITTGLPTVPVLADITGDGALDIVVAHAHTLKLYHYDPVDGLEIAWSYTLTNTTLRSGSFGSPAVADITGDGQPEIIINWGHRIEALTADGSLLWSYYTGSDNHYRPSPITVADTTGDGQMNLITASAVSAGFSVFNHNLMVLTADGALVWEQLVADNSASASGVAAQDLTGDGVWEVLWSGATDGFLVMRGTDGKRLFNEPLTRSGTIMEYPSLGDVDGDGVADVVVGGSNGLYVISHVGRWINSRPIWNQHNYHVTNINDDWSTPLVQPNSWEVHNTYRTQTPEQNPAPSYRVEITHTVDISGVTVLTDTFSTPPEGETPAYHWQYQLEWYAPINTITFDSEVADMQPGETRQVNNGTEIAYRLPSGWNNLTLPPLYITAARILEIAPDEQLVGVGGTAVYTLTLLNPGLADDLYSLEVVGLPAGWVDYPASVNVPAQSSLEVLLEVTVPAGMELAEWPFLVTAVTGGGGQDMVTASLALFNGLAIAIDPPWQSAPTGTAVSYTLTLTNSQQSTVNSQLSTAGLALVELPDEVEIPAQTAVSIPITVTGSAQGPQPFTVTAVGSGGQATASAVLEAIGHYAVGLALDPAATVAGAGTPALFSLALSNLGDVTDSYDLMVDAPAGWSYTLSANGTAVDSLTLPPQIFNSANLLLKVTPPVGTAVADYTVVITAQSQSRPGVQAAVTGTVTLLPLGVQVSISPPERSQSPLDPAVWQVTITNTGSVADSYDLVATGIGAVAAEFALPAVSLNPGQSQTVALSANHFAFALPQQYDFAVRATSQADGRIAHEAWASVTFSGFEQVTVTWLPASQTITNSLAAAYLLVISNTGNIPVSYQLAVELGGLSGLPPAPVVNVPAQAVAMLPVTVQAGGPGSYTLTATAVSPSGNSSDTSAATLTVVVEDSVLAVTAGANVTSDEGTAVTFNGIISHSGGGPYTILWNFGDGQTAEGTLTPSHLYADNGVYTVTLTVTAGSETVSDSLLVTVNNVAPAVTAVGDQSLFIHETLAGVIATFTDPGVLDTHTAVIDWGDGTVSAGVVNQATGAVSGSHLYQASGHYTVTVTVTDKDGDQGEATFAVVVRPYTIFLPFMLRDG